MPTPLRVSPTAPNPPARGRRLDDELQDLTALMDEFGSNLDVYSDRHADIRKSLKPLTAATQRWLGICAPWPANRALTSPAKRPSRAARTWPTKPTSAPRAD